jgi:hypothetical protein
MLALVAVALGGCQPSADAYPTMPIGTCGLAHNDGLEFESVDCALPHTHMLMAHVTDPNTDCPPGTDWPWTTPDGQGVWACWRAVGLDSPSP